MYLVLLMKEEGHTTTVTSHLSGIALTLIGFLFVDDTDLVTMGTKGESDTSIYNQLQASTNFWNGILQLLCGPPSPEKCWKVSRL